MCHSRADKFDFDEWMQLYKVDPEEFERRRLEAIEEIISSAPASSQRRLRGMQWRIDMERKRSKTPLESCVRIYDMLMDLVYSEKGFLNTLNMLTGCPCGAARHRTEMPDDPRSAEVIPIRRQAP